MTQYYKFHRFYFKSENERTEKITAYKHEYAISNKPSSTTIQYGNEGTVQITQAQFNRVKKVVLAKLLNQ